MPTLGDGGGGGEELLRPVPRKVASAGTAPWTAPTENGRGLLLLRSGLTLDQAENHAVNDRSGGTLSKGIAKYVQHVDTWTSFCLFMGNPRCDLRRA